MRVWSGAGTLGHHPADLLGNVAAGADHQEQAAGRKADLLQDELQGAPIKSSPTQRSAHQVPGFWTVAAGKACLRDSIHSRRRMSEA